MRRARRMFKKAVQRGRSESRGESYSVPYVEPLSDARTKLDGLFQHPARGNGYLSVADHEYVEGRVR